MKRISFADVHSVIHDTVCIGYRRATISRHAVYSLVRSQFRTSSIAAFPQFDGNGGNVCFFLAGFLVEN